MRHGLAELQPPDNPISVDVQRSKRANPDARARVSCWREFDLIAIVAPSD